MVASLPSHSLEPLWFSGTHSSQHIAASSASGYDLPAFDCIQVNVNANETEPGQVVRDVHDTQSRYQSEFGQHHSFTNESCRGSEPGLRGDEFPDVPHLFGLFPCDHTQALEAILRSVQTTLETQPHTPHVAPWMQLNSDSLEECLAWDVSHIPLKPIETSESRLGGCKPAVNVMLASKLKRMAGTSV